MKKNTTEKKSRRRPAAKSGGSKKSGRSFLRTASFIAAGIAAVIIVSLTVTAALLFDHPVAAENTMPSYKDLRRQQKIISRVSAEMRRNSNAENVVIALSPQEMGSMLKVALFTLRSSAAFNRKLAADLFPLLYGDISYRNGYFKANIPIDTGYRWLFGGAIYLKFRLQPEKTADSLDLDIEDLRAGVFRLPDDLSEQLINNACNQLLSQPEYSGYMKAVKELRINDNGAVEMVCNPRYLLPLLFGRPAAE